MKKLLFVCALIWFDTFFATQKTLTMSGSSEFTVSKKQKNSSVAKLKEAIGTSYGSIIKRTSQLNGVLVDCMECLLDGITLSQQELKGHRELVESFELQIQKFETALYEYRDQLQKLRDA